jgi:signal peptidase I
MLSTIFVVAIFVSLVVLQIILWAVFLRLGLRWARVPEVTTRRIVAATASVIAIQSVLYIPFRLFAPASDAQAIFIGVLELAATVLVPCLIIMQVFRARFFRSLQAWLPTLLPSVAMVLVAFLVLRPFICEAFVSPTNAMAPTLLGNHWQGRCPECGQPTFCSPVDAWYGRPETPRMICGNFHVNQIPDVPQQAFPPDRFLVAKFLTPKRWDVVVFQYPENPSTLYVMRLIGLPGETIHLEGGVVWANGNKLEPPDSLRGIEYLSELPDWPSSVWGTKDRPAVLGADEYFVLGDFSAQSRDSRLWEQGASGHNPFAVPESHMRGVVTHIYWPPQRWRILR